MNLTSLLPQVHFSFFIKTIL